MTHINEPTEWILMQKDILEQMRKLSHDDDRRYRLLLQYLRVVKLEKKQRGLLRRLKKKWETHLSGPSSNDRE